MEEERKKENGKDEKIKYIAHVDQNTGDEQALLEHLENVASLCKENCPLSEMENIAELCGLAHDIGKYRQAFQDYMEEVREKGKEAGKKSIDHTTAGGRCIWNLSKKSQEVPEIVNFAAAKLISTVVYSHHGLVDVLSPLEGKSLQEDRDKKEIDYEKTMQRCSEEMSEQLLECKFSKAASDMQKMTGKIGSIVSKYGAVCGRRNYYLGMYERTLQSLLIDSDWSDTASNAKGQALPHRISEEETQIIWEKCIENVEKKLAELRQKDGGKGVLNRYRQEMSDQCKKAAESENTLYRLTIPTGAGKTLSSLRFALYHAKKYRKKHIVYVAPFNSILEQNASVIRQAAGDGNVVLEHHCDVIMEDEEQNAKYQKLTENWDSPIIVTTAVQLLNALFSGSKRDVRRMYALCDSVLIVDEVQAIPVRCTELFSLAMNFMSGFGKTTVVLCSATQPSLVPLRHSRLFPCREMIADAERYSRYFERTQIIDQTNLVPGGMSLQDLKEFVSEQHKKYRKILIIVNTKSCAANLYTQLKEEYGENTWHLSTRMCAEHRKDTLSAIRKELDMEEQTVICVSTQLVEAGVDFSFDCVIRSMAGLDSIIQAAGRCNRNKTSNVLAPVYIVRMNQETENLSCLKEIKEAQDALTQLLYEYRGNPDLFEKRLDSQEAIRRYYSFYYQKKTEWETAYPCKEPTGTLVDFLSDNQAGLLQYQQVKHRKKEPFLNQAFATAGEKFEVIPEDQKVRIIVEYKAAEKWVEKLADPYLSQQERKNTLRQLQRYTVGISESERRRLGNAISESADKSVLILAPNYYDARLGIVKEPVNSVFIM